MLTAEQMRKQTEKSLQEMKSIRYLKAIEWIKNAEPSIRYQAFRGQFHLTMRAPEDNDFCEEVIKQLAELGYKTKKYSPGGILYYLEIRW